MSDAPGEAFVIRRLLAARPPLAVPPVDAGADDACVLEDGTVISSDALVEGVHFDARWSPADVGWRAVATNVSDLGAMGARPDWLTLALALPAPLDRAWVDDFAAGLGAALAAFRVRLVGGDTLRGPAVVASVTVGGRAARPVRRSGGRPGDQLWVTGRPGMAGLGFAHGPNPALLRPQPPVGLGVALAENGLVNAMMDISDGIARDLPRLCAASGVGAWVDPAALPPLEGLPPGVDPLPLQLGFGDDYELLFAAPPAHGRSISALAAAHGTCATPVGRLTPDREVVLAGRPWPGAAFSHFSPPAAAPC